MDIDCWLRSLRRYGRRILLNCIASGTSLLTSPKEAYAHPRDDRCDEAAANSYIPLTPDHGRPIQVPTFSYFERNLIEDFGAPQTGCQNRQGRRGIVPLAGHSDPVATLLAPG